MNRKVLLSAVALAITGSSFAQTKQDKKAIEDLCGCFAVTFNYAETFTQDTINKRYAHPKDNFAVTEYEYPIINTAKKVVIQHLLVIPDGKGTVIKHWREDWEFEKTTFWKYDKDKEWVKVQLDPKEVKGQWMQSIWEVNDAPRYQGSSEWIHTNNQTFWLNTTDAPLPRREYTTRHDYNVLNRTNRIIVSDNGYMHEQDNKKIIRKAGMPDSLLAQEKGYNQYVRLPEAQCANAKAFWTEKKATYWADVRAVWENKMETANKIKLLGKVEGKRLGEVLGEIEKRELNVLDRKSAIKTAINKYIKVLS